MSNKRFRNPFEKYVAPTIAGAALVGGGVEAVTPPAKAEEYIGATEQEVTQVTPDVVRAQSVLAAVNEARAGQGLRSSPV